MRKDLVISWEDKQGVQEKLGGKEKETGLIDPFKKSGCENMVTNRTIARGYCRIKGRVVSSFHIPKENIFSEGLKYQPDTVEGNNQVL